MKTKARDVLLAISSGALTALAFPKFGLSFLAWVSLLPLLFLLLKRTPRQSFWLGLTAGFIFYAILLYWIPSVPAHYGGLSPWLSLLVYLILVLFLALFWGLFGFLSTRLHRRFPRLGYLLLPLVWISLEYILTYILTGFPWGLLGTTQYKNLPYIQLASLTGVYGLSFILVLFQSAFVYSFASRKRSPFFVVLGLVLFLHLGGWLSIRKIAPTSDSFTASVLQGNVSSDIYWDQVSPEEVRRLFEQHMELSEQAFQSGARLIIWPEFSVTLCFSCPQEIYQYFKDRLTAFVQTRKATLLLGTNETTGPPRDLKYRNTALCLAPDLSITQYYKMHLVPFGEYTPYKKIFFFIEKVTHAIGDITPGTDHILHQFEDNKFGSPICYEVIFPDLVRKFAKKGASFLVTITNDGWYGKTSAPYQHFSMAVLRAVENRRFLLRAATTGISGIVDPYGRILSQSELLTRTFLTGQITPSQELSFYTRFGDLLPLVGLTLTVISFILALVKRNHG